MEKSELNELKEQLEAKGIKWEEAAEKIKFDVRLLNLYLVSPPVPISVINPLKKLLEAAWAVRSIEFGVRKPSCPPGALRRMKMSNIE